MTVFDSIKNKNIDELAEWLNENIVCDSAPWWKYFDENYCNKCEGIETETTNVFGCTIEYAYCELNGNCRFFNDREDIPDSKQIVKMWLKSDIGNECAAINDVVMCRDCKYIMYSDCYGECSQGHKGIITPYDSCGYGAKRNTEEKI